MMRIVAAALLSLLVLQTGNALACTAVAVNTGTLAFGLIVNAATSQAAEKGALRKCGSGCKVAASSCATGCGALAVGRKGKSPHWGLGGASTGSTGSDLSLAKSRAIAQCGGKTYGCAVAVSGCNSRPAQ